MALSGFIKQLLETDSVFGSRAKKLTGINDREAVLNLISQENQDNYGKNVIIDISVEPSEIQIIIFFFSEDGESIRPIPSFIRPGGFFRLGLSNFITADDQFPGGPEPRPAEVDRAAAEKIDGVVLQINTVFPFNPENTRDRFGPRLFIGCDPSAGDGPRLQALLEQSGFNDDLLQNFGPVDIALDGRIASLIEDPNIADYSSRGSTRYNLDNIEVRTSQDRGSGIASRYAAHYHGDKLINLVTNTRDDQNQLLYGIQLNENKLDDSTFSAIYDPDKAFTFVLDSNEGTSDQIRVDYSTSLTAPETVATYGYIGTRGQGQINLSFAPTSRTSSTNFGTRIAFENVIFEYDLPFAEQTPFLKQWPTGLPTTPSLQLHEELRTLRDAVRRELGTTRWVVDITSSDQAPTGVLRVQGGRNDNNNIPLTYFKAPLAPFDAITTVPVTGCSSPRPVEGIEFITFQDLFNVLSVNTRFNITVELDTPPNSLEFSTQMPPEKIIRLMSPPAAPDIFTDLDGGIVLAGDIGAQSLNQVVIPVEIVLDLNGNVVFSRENVN